MPVTHPVVTTLQCRVPGQGTAGTDSTWIVGRAPYAGVLSSATYTTDAGITGHASNNRALSIINKKLDGSGSTSMATVTTDGSNSFTAFDEKALPLSGTAANLVVAEGDILAFLSDAAASGVIDPGGLIVLKIDRS